MFAWFRFVLFHFVPFALCVILDSSFSSSFCLRDVLPGIAPLEILRRRLDLVSIVSSCCFSSVPSFRFILGSVRFASMRLRSRCMRPYGCRVSIRCTVPSFHLFRFGSFVPFYSCWYHTTSFRSSRRFGSVVSVPSLRFVIPLSSFLFLSIPLVSCSCFLWPVIFVTSVRTLVRCACGRGV